MALTSIKINCCKFDLRICSQKTVKNGKLTLIWISFFAVCKPSFTSPSQSYSFKPRQLFKFILQKKTSKNHFKGFFKITQNVRLKCCLDHFLLVYVMVRQVVQTWANRCCLSEFRTGNDLLCTLVQTHWFEKKGEELADWSVFYFQPPTCAEINRAEERKCAYLNWIQRCWFSCRFSFLV